jgi:hypothetical protein
MCCCTTKQYSNWELSIKQIAAYSKIASTKLWSKNVNASDDQIAVRYEFSR